MSLTNRTTLHYEVDYVFDLIVLSSDKNVKPNFDYVTRRASFIYRCACGNKVVYPSLHAHTLDAQLCSFQGKTIAGVVNGGVQTVAPAVPNNICLSSLDTIFMSLLHMKQGNSSTTSGSTSPPPPSSSPSSPFSALFASSGLLSSSSSPSPQ